MSANVRVDRPGSSTSRALRARQVRDERGAPRRARSSRILTFTLAAALLVALGVFHIWSRTRVLASGYALGELSREHQRLSTEHDRLRIEVETLRSPAALERYARTTLGMAPPAPGAVWAATPRIASADAGRVGGDGVGHRRRGPAEPVSEVPGKLASRGPLRAGRVPPREP